ncbi:TetR family transcriptional regulator [Amycolatopsis echigonensis]|uniref:TetR family transcriptional regulator n=1 Tax=Amycolatopsis echigonensis TaxID=2576905 RepID=A0A2N3X1U3_9PSEU|nr:TetR/AcrR family transcriptional regulator [Amycolatopsis niigatensis]PKW00091.1 TetR family transcriptional regulator [Amycolatopsis niigatensis]
MPRRYSMHTRRRASEQARTRIFDATLDALVASGGQPVTMQEIADRADMAPRTLYNHFSSRDTLLTAAFTHHTAQTRGAIEALGLPDAPPEHQLQHIVEAYYTRYAQMGPRLTVLLAQRDAPELDEQIRAIRRWRRTLLTNVIERARRDGKLAISAPAALALTYTLTSHAGWQTLLDTLDGDTAAAARTATETLTSALFHHKPNTPRH